MAYAFIIRCPDLENFNPLFGYCCSAKTVCSVEKCSACQKSNQRSGWLVSPTCKNIKIRKNENKSI